MEPFKETVQEPLMPTTTTMPGKSPTHKKLWMVIVVVVLIAAAAVWFFFYKQSAKELTPEETLQQLEATSNPITATPAERKAELDALAKQSAPVKTTVDDRERGLRLLRGESEQ